MVRSDSPSPAREDARRPVRAAAVAASALLALCACGKQDGRGAELAITAAAGTPAAAGLLLTWRDEAATLRRDEPVPIKAGADGVTRPLAVVRLSLAGAAGRRWAVVRGVGGDGAIVSEGAAIVDVAATGWTPATVQLEGGRRPDADGDGVPDAIDECRADPTRHAGCAPDGGVSPDAAAPDAAPDAVPDAAPDATERDTRTADGAPNDATPPVDAAADGPPADVPAPPDAGPDGGPPCRALLAIGSATPNPSELATQMRLEKTLGCMVTLRRESELKPEHLTGHTLVVIGTSSGSSPSYTFLRTAALPILVLEMKALPELRMTGPTENTHWGATMNVTQLDVTAGHALAAGLSGKVTVTDAAGSFSWGVPVAGATRVASIGGGVTGSSTIFALEPGASLGDAGTLANRRVAWLIEESGIPRLNANGWRLFDAAVRYTLGQ